MDGPNPSHSNKELLLTEQQAAERAQVDRRTIRHLIDAGRLRALDLGNGGRLCNRSEQGAATQGILMSIYRTLKLRGLDATRTIAEALRNHLITGTLPDLPGGVATG